MSSTTVQALLAPGTLGRAIAAGVVLATGWILARLASAGAHKLVGRRGNAQQALIARRFVLYLILGVTLVAVLRELGVDLSVLLGAAGVLTVALGFAAQTAASNLISGMFLIGERAFVIGDFIEVGANVGYVMSIDLLSVKLRTLDNVSVRVPNEMMLKQEVVNYTRYAIRRVALALTVVTSESLDRVRDTLLAVAAAEPLCLQEPAAQLNVRGFGPAGVDLQLMVWVRSENVQAVSSSLHYAAHDALQRAGVSLATTATTVVTPARPIVR
jgi:small-conductance mechanosensitive channel